MRRLAFFVLAMAVLSFAAPSEKPRNSKKLPLPQELQAEELPWFAFTARNKGAYETLNRDRLKEIAKERKAKRVVFAFFARWCVPCREGLKLLSDNSEELKKRGVLVILVNVAERNMDDYSQAAIESWTARVFREEWLLGFNRFSNSLEKFGLIKDGTEDGDMPLPATLVADGNLRPLALIGTEGDDYINLLWGE